MISTLIRPVAAAAPTRYRYVGQQRTIDQPSTKRFRKRLRKLSFEIVADDGAFASCRGSDGIFYTWLPLNHLEPVGDEGGAE